MKPQQVHNSAQVGASSTWQRAAALFANFFVIIFAYYQVKPASKSLMLEYGEAIDVTQLRFIAAAILLGLMPFYQKLIQRVSRMNVVVGAGSLFAGSLIIFYFLLNTPNYWVVAALSLLVNIMSVVMVEQFWSLTNSAHCEFSAKKAYWGIGSGGLLGGIAGGLFAKMLIEQTSLATLDLLLVAAALICAVIISTLWLGQKGFYTEVEEATVSEYDAGHWFKDRYLWLVASLLLLAQAVEPVIEYQFNVALVESYPEQESRTGVLSGFFALISAAGLLINVVFTRVVHRYLGIFAALLMQPLLIGASAIAFIAQPGFISGGAMRLLDRALSYSVGRASREVLYTPVSAAKLYAAKAWIDMFGYRASQLAGSAVVTLAVTYFSGAAYFSYAILLVCLYWVGAIFALSRQHRVMKNQTLAASELALQKAEERDSKQAAAAQ